MFMRQWVMFCATKTAHIYSRNSGWTDNVNLKEKCYMYVHYACYSSYLILERTSIYMAFFSSYIIVAISPQIHLTSCQNTILSTRVWPCHCWHNWNEIMHRMRFFLKLIFVGWKLLDMSWLIHTFFRLDKVEVVFCNIPGIIVGLVNMAPHNFSRKPIYCSVNAEAIWL